MEYNTEHHRLVLCFPVRQVRLWSSLVLASGGPDSLDSQQEAVRVILIPQQKKNCQEPFTH